MAGVVLLVILTLSLHRLLLRPITAGLQPWVEAPWGLWLLLLVGLWLFSGPRRDP